MEPDYTVKANPTIDEQIITITSPPRQLTLAEKARFAKLEAEAEVHRAWLLTPEGISMQAAMAKENVETATAIVDSRTPEQIDALWTQIEDCEDWHTDDEYDD